MRLVLVEWLDSYGCSSEWQRLEGQAPQAVALPFGRLAVS